MFFNSESSETLMLLYFASRIRPQCVMLHVLKSEVSIREGLGGGGGGRGLGPLFLNVLDPPLTLKLKARVFNFPRFEFSSFIVTD